VALVALLALLGTLGGSLSRTAERVSAVHAIRTPDRGWEGCTLGAPEGFGGRGEITKGRAPARAPPRRASPAAHPCLPPHPQSLHLCLPRHPRPQSLQHRSPRCQSPKRRSLRRQHPSPRPRYWEVPPAPAAKTRVQGTVRPVGPPCKSSTSSVPAENLFTEPRRRGILRTSP